MTYILIALDWAIFICSLYDWMFSLSPFYAGLIRFMHLRGDMNKLDSKYETLSISSASQADLESARRLIVLVPSLEVDLTAVTRRVWELANATGSHVQFLGLYDNPEQESSLRRQLVTMSAMVRDGKVSAEVDVIFGKDWVDAVKTRFRSDDTVMCFAEQRVGSSARPLSQVLQSELNVQLYILSGLYPRNNTQLNWPSEIAAWMGSIAIIFGFFLLQVKVNHLTQDWMHVLLLLLSIPAEITIIWGWNSLLG